MLAPVVSACTNELESRWAEVAQERPLVGVSSPDVQALTLISKGVAPSGVAAARVHVPLEALAGGEDELADFTGVGATAPPSAAARRLRLFTARGVKRC